MMRTIVVSLGIALAAVMASCSRDASRESTASCPGARRDHHCALGAGGGSDVLSRTIANVLRELKLVPVNLLVENRPGSSGAIGYTYVARQAANPYALATVSVSFFTTPLLGASSHLQGLHAGGRDRNVAVHHGGSSCFTTEVL